MAAHTVNSALDDSYSSKYSALMLPDEVHNLRQATNKPPNRALNATWVIGL
jgi:hypothetical protein